MLLSGRQNQILYNRRQIPACIWGICRVVYRIWFFSGPAMPGGQQSAEGAGMVIGKVINNNVISSWDGEHKEIIVMGRGIGFQKKREILSGKRMLIKYSAWRTVT